MSRFHQYSNAPIPGGYLYRFTVQFLSTQSIFLSQCTVSSTLVSVQVNFCFSYNRFMHNYQLITEFSPLNQHFFFCCKSFRLLHSHLLLSIGRFCRDIECIYKLRVATTTWTKRATTTNHTKIDTKQNKIVWWYDVHCVCTQSRTEITRTS